MDTHAPVRVIGPAEFVTGTAQTPGCERLAAIAPGRVDSALWGGLFEVKPGAHTGIHHHGAQQTVAYVLQGVCEIRWGEYATTAKVGDFIHVAA